MYLNNDFWKNAKTKTDDKIDTPKLETVVGTEETKDIINFYLMLLISFYCYYFLMCKTKPGFKRNFE